MFSVLDCHFEHSEKSFLDPSHSFGMTPHALFFHHRYFRFHTLPLQFFQKHWMNVRRLFIKRNHFVQFRPEAILAVFGTSTAHGEVAQGCVYGVKVAVVHQIAGRINRAGLDFEARALLAFAPDHGETFALSHAYDRARAVPMKSAPAPRRKFLDVTTVGRAREAEAHNLDAFALHRVIVEGEFIHIRHQITLPRADRQLLVLIEKLAVGTKAIAKLKWIAENKIVVVKQIDHVRRIGAGEKTHRLGGSIEMLVGNIERYCENRPRAPLKRLLGISFEPNRRRAASFVNVHEGFEHMVLRFGLFSRRDLANVSVGLLLLAQIEKRAEHAHARPRLHLHLHQIFNEKSRDGWNSFFLLEHFVRCRSQTDRVAMRQSHGSSSPYLGETLRATLCSQDDSIISVCRNFKASS